MLIPAGELAERGTPTWYASVCNGIVKFKEEVFSVILTTNDVTKGLARKGMFAQRRSGTPLQKVQEKVKVNV
jgi:hypothetical protein